MSDRESRIALRKSRMLARKQKELSKNNTSDSNAKSNSTNQSIHASQLESSRSLIDAAKYHAMHDITSVKLDVLSRENARRLEEEIRKKSRILSVESESNDSDPINQNLELNWMELQSATVPQDLHRDIISQREYFAFRCFVVSRTCAKVLAAKTELIVEFQEELNTKNDQYVKMLLQQSDDISLLLKKMHAQYALLQKTFEDEENRIETAFVEERKAMVSSNRKGLLLFSL